MTKVQRKRLVAATDFSEHANNGALRAAMLASEQRAELELLHVVSKPSLDAVRKWVRTPVDVAERLVEDARRILADSVTSIAGTTGVTSTARVTVGDVLTEILSNCQSADILVVGARGLNPLRDAILGTTAERLLGKCHRPILIVKRPPEGSYARVLVPLDFSSYAEGALRMATSVAPDAMIVAVHAYEMPFEGRLRLAGVSDEDIEGHRLRIAQKAEADIRALWERVGAGRHRFSHFVERGSPALVILDQEKAVASDLIVIGKHARSAAEAFLLGSVTRRVLADSSCDVLVVQES